MDKKSPPPLPPPRSDNNQSRVQNSNFDSEYDQQQQHAAPDERNEQGGGDGDGGDHDEHDDGVNQQQPPKVKSKAPGAGAGAGMMGGLAGPGMLGELRNRQKMVGRYVSSSDNNQLTSTQDQEAQEQVQEQEQEQAEVGTGTGTGTGTMQAAQGQYSQETTDYENTGNENKPKEKYSPARSGGIPMFPTPQQPGAAQGQGGGDADFFNRLAARKAQTDQREGGGSSPGFESQTSAGSTPIKKPLEKPADPLPVAPPPSKPAPPKQQASAVAPPVPPPKRKEEPKSQAPPPPPPSHAAAPTTAPTAPSAAAAPTAAPEESKPKVAVPPPSKPSKTSPPPPMPPRKPKGEQKQQEASSSVSSPPQPAAPPAPAPAPAPPVGQQQPPKPSKSEKASEKPSEKEKKMEKEMPKESLASSNKRSSSTVKEAGSETGKRPAFNRRTSSKRRPKAAARLTENMASVNEAMEAATQFKKDADSKPSGTQACDVKSLQPRKAREPPKSAEELAEEEREKNAKLQRRGTPPPTKEYDPSDDWECYQTPEGEPYYVNKVTGITQWDKPVELLDESELERLQGDWIWVQHAEFAWVPAKIVRRLAGNDLEVLEMAEGLENETGETRTVTQNEVGPAIQAPKVLRNLTSDLVQLDHVHEPGIIDLLRRRYRRDKIYTSVGDILIAVNPFKATSLFTPALMHKYATLNQDSMELPPHPYAVINSAFQDMIEYHHDQSLLISGESGAGKTVTVKVCLEFLSEVAGSSKGIEQKVLASNPILEAFGNAKTVRNDNSSRFGKFMEIHFDTQGNRSIVGCSTVNYLLEKSRVVAQATGERNFHIFYYMLLQFPADQQKQLYLHGRKPESFYYLSQDGKPCASPDQHDDADECSKMQKAFEEMGISAEEQQNIYRCAAAVLHLGEVGFEDFESTGSKVTGNTKKTLDNISALLQVDPGKLADSLTMLQSQQRDGMLTRAFNPNVAADARNALARHLYGRLFQFLVNRINDAMGSSPSKMAQEAEGGVTNFIGMLDIFGFEIFEENSFEQLCINFANEKLQQMFNRHTFLLEEKTYENQGIDFERIEFHDSQPLLSFLGLAPVGEKSVRDGVFQLLDEQTVIGSGSDEKFLSSLKSRHSDKKHLFSDMCKSRTAFKIFHYAGVVEYESTSFVSKNADKLYENIIDVMQSSSNSFVSEVLFGDGDHGVLQVAERAQQSIEGSQSLDPGSSPAQSQPKAKHKTQASLFIMQLQKLEERTNATFPRYIRCIKPNGFKRPKIFQSNSALQQLRFAGVFEAVSIRKKGYPFRHTHKHFFETFRSVVPHAYTWEEWRKARVADADEGSSSGFKKLAEKIQNALAAGPVPEAKDCRFGKTMVLYRAAEHRALEISRLKAINSAASRIEKVGKGRLVRKHVPQLKKIRTDALAAINARDLSKLDSIIAEGNDAFFKIKEVFDAEAVAGSIRQEKSMQPRLSKALVQDTETESGFKELETLVREMNKFTRRDPLAFKTVPEAQQLQNLYAVEVDKREALDSLKKNISQIGQLPITPSIQELQSSVANAIEVAKAAGNHGGFFAQEVEKAASELQQLSTELNLAEQAQAAATESEILGDADHQQPGEVDSQSKCEPNIGAFRAAVEALEHHEPIANDVKRALATMKSVVKLREKSLKALALGEAAAANEPEWRDVEASISELRGLPAAEEGEDVFSFEVSENEVALISTELFLRAAVDDVLAKLNSAVAAVSDEALGTALEQANRFNMSEHPDDEVRAIVAKAEDLLPRVQYARESLRDALEEVDEEKLALALRAQASCGFGEQPGMDGHQMVQEARQLFAWVLELTRQARIAVQVLDIAPIENIINGCKEIGLEIEELETLREFMALSRDRQLLKQRQAAIDVQNYRRAVRLAMEHKDILFNDADGKYELANFKNLKTPEAFAKRFGVKWQKYKDSMLSWYSPFLHSKLHTSLTVIECGNEEETKAMNKRATYMFKNILGIMGDKNFENVDALFHEILQEGLEHPILRDEIYCQLMKQLNKNPNQESVAKGWNLMAACLLTFPASNDLEMYLEHFLRKCNRRDLVELQHMTLLGGQLTQLPSIDFIAEIRQPGNTSFWMPGKRSQITFEEEMWQGEERVDQVVENWRDVYYVPGSESGERSVERKQTKSGRSSMKRQSSRAIKVGPPESQEAQLGPGKRMAPPPPPPSRNSTNVRASVGPGALPKPPMPARRESSADSNESGTL